MKNRLLFFLALLAGTSTGVLRADEVDYTSYIKNPSFEEAETRITFNDSETIDAGRRFEQPGWEYQYYYEGTALTRYDVARKYVKDSATKAELSNMAPDVTDGASCFALRINAKGYENYIYQDIANLPAGNYRLTVDVQGVGQLGKVRLTVGERQMEAYPIIKSTTTMERIYLCFSKTESESVRIGVHVDNKTRGGSTAILVDNFRLTKLTEDVTPTYENPANVTGLLVNPSFEDGVVNVRQKYYRPNGWSYEYPAVGGVTGESTSNDPLQIANVYLKDVKVNDAGITSTIVSDGDFCFVMRRNYTTKIMRIFQTTSLKAGTYRLDVDVQGAPNTGYVEVMYGDSTERQMASTNKAVVVRKSFLMHIKPGELLTFAAAVKPADTGKDCQLNVDNFQLFDYGLSYLNHKVDSLQAEWDAIKDNVPAYLQQSVAVPAQNVESLLTAMNALQPVVAEAKAQIAMRKPLLDDVQRVEAVMASTKEVVADQTLLSDAIADLQTLYDAESTTATIVAAKKKTTDKLLLDYAGLYATDIADIRVVESSSTTGSTIGWMGSGRTVVKGESWSGDKEDTYYKPSGGNYNFAQQLAGLRPGVYSVRLAVRCPSGVSATATLYVADKNIASYKVPQTGSTGGTIWEYAEAGSAIKLANGGKGYGWDWVVFDNIKIEAGNVLKFGLSGNGSVSMDNNAWLYYYGGDLKQQGEQLLLRGDMAQCQDELATILATGEVLSVDWKSVKGETIDAGNNNPNLLVYRDATTAGIENSIAVTGGEAGVVTLTDGKPLAVPTQFTAEAVSYVRSFTKENSVTQTALGWHTLVLPFTPQEITAINGLGATVTMAPFDPDTKTVPEGSVPFWLKELTSEGYVDVATIEPNKPYLICMPNNPKYNPAYCIQGNATFTAANATVKQTEEVVSTGNGEYNLVSTLRGEAKGESVFVMDQIGSGFVISTDATEGREVVPFEAYAVAQQASASPVRRYNLNMDKVSTGVEELLLAKDQGDLLIYAENSTLKVVSAKEQQLALYGADGRLIRMLVVKEGANYVSLPAGIYFIQNQKVVLN